jgi:hypothetical protein
MGRYSCTSRAIGFSRYAHLDSYPDEEAKRHNGVARRRSVMEMIAAYSSSSDAAGSVDVARAPRRGPASRSSQLGGARWSTAGLSADAAMESGCSRLVAPQAAGRRPSRSVSGPRLERGAGGRSWDDLPERSDGADRDQERVEELELEALAVPGEDGRGLDNDEAGPPARPQL